MFILFIRLIRRFVLLLACTLPALSAALAPNTGDVGLRSTLSMDVQVNQAGGACHGDYRWHTVYGGCRRAVVEREQQREACGADYTGEQSRARERTQYILQATGQAANGSWGEWGAWDRSACVAVNRRKSGIIWDDPIAEALGVYIKFREMEEFTRDLPPGPSFIHVINNQFSNSGYAVTLERSNAQLQCVFLLSFMRGPEGEHEIWWKSWLLPLGKSFETPHGHCQLSNENMHAQIYGDLIRLEPDGHWSGTYDVSVTAVGACSATVAVTETMTRHVFPDPSTSHSEPWSFIPYPPTTRQQSYDLCS